jgi:hypothetical protein
MNSPRESSGRFSPPADLVGQTFGRLSVLCRAEKGGGWRCVCRCGRRTTVRGHRLVDGHTKSCGCLAKEVASKTHREHGLSHSRTYSSWAMMIQRCTNPRLNRYHRYGGRGISVCTEWMDFTVFLRDMGERPPGCSLDRIDNNLGYTKANCRWSTPREQAMNRSNTYQRANWAMYQERRRAEAVR